MSNSIDLKFCHTFARTAIANTKYNRHFNASYRDYLSYAMKHFKKLMKEAKKTELKSKAVNLLGKIVPCFIDITFKLILLLSAVILSSVALEVYQVIESVDVVTSPALISMGALTGLMLSTVIITSKLNISKVG